MSSLNIFNQDSDIAILSIILQYPDRFYDLKYLKSFMLNSVANQLLFSTIEDLVSQGLVPEVNLIESFLKSKNKDLQIGGRDYLNYLTSQKYNPDNIKEFEKIALNNFKAKTLISLSTKVTSSLEAVDDVDKVIADYKRSLESLSDHDSGSTTLGFEAILQLGWEDIKERVKNPGPKGITSGFKNMDYNTSGISPGEEWFIAGRPGMGKSAMWCNMALTQAKAGKPVLAFSLEMNETTINDRLLAIETGIPQMSIRLGLLNQEQLDKISDTMKLIKKLPIYIDFNYYANMNYIESTTRRYKRNYGIEVAYLDYVQLAVERSVDATNELGRFSRGIKLLSNDLGIGTVVLSQLNRNCELREDKRPMLSDLRQSGNLEEDADVVIGLYRDIKYNKKAEYPDLMETIILKQRNGPTGSVLLTFENETNKIMDR